MFPAGLPSPKFRVFRGSHGRPATGAAPGSLRAACFSASLHRHLPDSKTAAWQRPPIGIGPARACLPRRAARAPCRIPALGIQTLENGRIAAGSPAFPGLATITIGGCQAKAIRCAMKRRSECRASSAHVQTARHARERQNVLCSPCRFPVNAQPAKAILPIKMPCPLSIVARVSVE